MFDTKALAEATAAVVRDHFDKQVAPLLKRIEALEAREFPDIDKKLMEAMEGIIDNDDVKAICEQLIGELPKPVDGKDGKDGVDGKDGINGKDGTNGVDGKDGREGIDGKDGREGIDGKDGKDGVNGRDGLDAREFIRANGRLIVTMSDGSTKDLGVIDGKDGEPGKDGRDGFSLRNFDASLMDDGRTVLLTFAEGDQAFSAELSFPAMIYRGVYNETQQYQRGDTVTFGGSLWHCDNDALGVKPDATGDMKSWTLCAKRGRDGKDGAARETKPVGPVKVG